ncbi:MAG: polyprenyl synthetase family protein [Betaproteobacteria bacterium]|nr:polyprenyl synthetase family protein [Betaproteobacteria bacterium]
MQQVDASIRRALASDVPLISAIGGYIVGAGGKRLRPALLLLVAGAHGYRGPHLHDLAAVIEMIHTATLLHDDVVDESELRRGRQTSNAAYGNAASVLSGDFLYSRSFQMMVAAGNLRILSILADATNVIAEGEVQQLINMHDPQITVEQYMRVIHDKTAALFEAAARIGAVLAGCGAQAEEQAAAYGRSLGLAFQLIDDALDYNGQAEQMGKNVGDDLREGKPTLPLIVAMQRADAPQRALIEHAIREGAVDSLPGILEIVHACGALDEVYAVASGELRKARGLAQAMPAGAHQRALVELCDYSLERNA